MNRSLRVLLALSLVSGCTFNWDSSGIRDVKVANRPAAEIAAGGEPAPPPSAPTADAATNAGSSSNVDSSTNTDSDANSDSGGWWIFGKKKDDKLEEEKTNLIRIAILPVAWRGDSGGQPCDLCSPPVEMKPTSEHSARLAAGFIYEAIARHPRFLFPTPETVDQAMRATADHSQRAAASSLAASGRADYVVVVALIELRQRVGPDDHPEKAAGVAMFASLVDPKSGKVVWSDTFDQDESGRGMVLGTYDTVMNDRPVRWSTAEGYSEQAVDELIDDLVDELD